MQELPADLSAALKAALQNRVDEFLDTIPGAIAAVVLIDTGPALLVIVTADVNHETTTDQARSVGRALHGLGDRVPAMLIERIAERS